MEDQHDRLHLLLAPSFTALNASSNPRSILSGYILISGHLILNVESLCRHRTVILRFNPSGTFAPNEVKVGTIDWSSFLEIWKIRCSNTVFGLVRVFKIGDGFKVESS